MEFFDFDSLSSDAREETLAFFQADTQPQPVDNEPTSYSAMVGEALEEHDWLGEVQEEEQRAEGTNLAVSGKPSHDGTHHDGISKTSKMLPCTWDTCEKILEKSELTLHLKDHGDVALQQFQPWSPCVWPNCSSKISFKNQAAYRHHLANIHTDPLVCTVAKCPYKKAFRNQDDLDRHCATKHSNIKVYECPYDSCSSDIKAFARKDKWLKHIQETTHDNDAFCPYYHCALEQAGTPGFKDRKQISKHFSKVHARNPGESYECALYLCAEATHSSYWNKDAFKNHLNANHGIPWWHIGSIDHAVGEERIVTAKHLDHPGLVLRAAHRDCSLCSKARSQRSSYLAPAKYQGSTMSDATGPRVFSGTIY